MLRCDYSSLLKQVQKTPPGRSVPANCEWTVCFVGKIAPRRHMCFCRCLCHFTRSICKAQLAAGPGTDVSKAQQGAACSGLSVHEGPQRVIAGSKCPGRRVRGGNERGFWEET